MKLKDKFDKIWEKTFPPLCIIALYGWALVGISYVDKFYWILYIGATVASIYLIIKISANTRS